MTRTISVQVETDDGVEVTVQIPARWEICPVCKGDGSHCHPAIDGNGITASEWAGWDREDQQAYFEGQYNVPCDCQDGKVLVPDDDLLTDEHRTALNYQAELRAFDQENRMERLAEMRFGC